MYLLLPVNSSFPLYIHCSSKLRFTVREDAGFAEYRAVENGGKQNWVNNRRKEKNYRAKVIILG